MDYKLKPMKRTLFFIAVFGWCAGLAVHLLSLMDIDVRAYFEPIWLLHIGIFVVFVPAVFELNKNESIKELRKANKKPGSFELYKIIFQNTPNWLKIIAIAGFLYAVINFLFFMATQGGSPSIKDGQYVLQNHGNILKVLTETEYTHYRANEIKGFSGHWLAFYGFAAAILYPTSKSLSEASSD